MTTPDDLELLTLPLLGALERLTRLERAIYVLHQVLGYPRQQIANALAMSEAAAETIFARAKAQLAQSGVLPH
ncbi:MAG TPA: sigma factor-like helix-turn-helix DNA-binding protein [Polyangiales bacterium]|nr:sigma factor-like helix-turn-helix DNA-binding protein [Polyangiales bacterium]